MASNSKIPVPPPALTDDDPTKASDAERRAYDRLMEAARVTTAAHDQKQVAQRTRTRHSMSVDVLDQLFTLANRDEADYSNMHERPSSDYASYAPLREDFCTHLDHLMSEKRAEMGGGVQYSKPDAILQAARYALRRASTKQAEAVERCYFTQPAMTHAELARETGVERRTISYRFSAGTQFLADFCAEHGLVVDF